MRSRRVFLKHLSVGGAAFPIYESMVPNLRGKALDADQGGPASMDSLAGKVKITDLQIIPVTLPNSPNTYVFVEVLTNAGVKGLGEATLEGKPEATMGALRDLRHFLIGKDPTMIIPNFLIQEVVYGLPARNAIVSEPIEKVTDGYVELPRKPGLGVELNHNVIQQYGYRHPDFEEVYRPDGSVGEN